MTALLDLQAFDKKSLKITNWVGTGTDRVGVMSYFTTLGKQTIRLEIVLDLIDRSTVELITLSEAQLRHLKPDGDGYSINFMDYNDPA